jgi:hypothetical protein
VSNPSGNLPLGTWRRSGYCLFNDVVITSVFTASNVTTLNAQLLGKGVKKTVVAQFEMRSHYSPSGTNTHYKINSQDSKRKKTVPVTRHEGPEGCESSRLPHFLQTVGSQMAVRLSDLRASRPLPPRNLPGTHFC